MGHVHLCERADLALLLLSGDGIDDHHALPSASHPLPPVLCDGAIGAAILLSCSFRAGAAGRRTAGLPSTYSGSRFAQSAPGQPDGGESRDPGLRLSALLQPCLLYTSPSPRDRTRSRMPSSA